MIDGEFENKEFIQVFEYIKKIKFMFPKLILSQKKNGNLKDLV